MMVKKNLDLELQALHMIQQRNGVVPKAFESGNIHIQVLLNANFEWLEQHWQISSAAKNIFPIS